MKIKLLIVMIFFPHFILHAQVFKSIEVEAGHLSISLSLVEKNTVTDLKISGTIDARDFKTLRDQLGSLRNLDIEDASIVEYNGSAGPMDGTVFYPKDEIPKSAFHDLSVNRSLKSLNTIKFPKTLNSIGQLAFANCTGLEGAFVIPGTVERIDASAFSYCTNIDSLILEEGVETLKGGAFSNCSGLMYVYIPSTLSAGLGEAFVGCSGNIEVSEKNLYYAVVDGVLYNKDLTTLIHYPLDGLSNFSIPPTVNEIGAVAFQSCKNLSYVEIPNSVVSIGKAAFISCGLDSITIPANVTKVEGSAFLNCYKLKAVTIASSGGYIGNSSFSSCPNLETVRINDGLASIGWGAFEFCKKLKSITIPGTVKEIENQAFMSCDNLKQVNISKGTEIIGGYAFAYHANMDTVSINLPSTVKQIGGGAFSFSNSVISVDEANSNFVFTNGILFDKERTQLIYYNPSLIGEYIIPMSVHIIGTAAFADCRYLTSLTFHENIDSIADNVFGNDCGLTSLYVNSPEPLKLPNSYPAFGGIDASNCVLYVPFKSSASYKQSVGWDHFIHFSEMPGFKLSNDGPILIGNEDNEFSLTINANMAWEIASDQAWLTVEPSTGSTNKTLTCKATANPNYEERIATLSISALGVDTLDVKITQEAKWMVGFDQQSLGTIIYPNPITSEFRINGFAEGTKLKIVNIDGRVLRTVSVPQDGVISCTNLEHGIYYIQIEGHSKRFKILKE